MNAVVAVCLAAGSSLAQPVVPGATVELLATLPNGYRAVSIDWGFDPLTDGGRWLYLGSDNNTVSGVPLVRISLGTAPSGPGLVKGYVDTYSVPVRDPDGVLVDRSGLLTGVAGTALAACGDNSRGRVWSVDPSERDLPTDQAPVHPYILSNDALNDCGRMTQDGDARLYFEVAPDNEVVRMVGLPDNGAATLEVFASLPTAPGTLAWDGIDGLWTAGGDGVMRRFGIAGVLPRPVELEVNLGTGVENSLAWTRVVPGLGGAWGGGMLAVRRAGPGVGELVRIRNNGLVDLLGTGMGDVSAMTVDDMGVLYAADFGTGAVWRIARENRLGCGPGDVGGPGGFSSSDGTLDNNDFIAFIDLFFANDARGDRGVAGGFRGSDGRWDNNDFIAFIDEFFEGC